MVNKNFNELIKGSLFDEDYTGTEFNELMKGSLFDDNKTIKEELNFGTK